MEDMAMLILLFTSLFVGVCHGLCGREVISSCMDSLNSTSLSYREIQHLTRMGKTDDVSYVTIAVPKNITASCSDYNVLDECIENDMASCADITRASYNGISKSYNYLCSDGGKKSYASVSSCLFGEELLTTEHKCEEKFKDNPELFNRTQTELTLSFSNFKEDEREEICKKFSLTMSLLSCQTAAVNKTCGKEAAQLWTEYIQDKLSDFNLEMPCKEYEGDDGVIMKPGEFLVCDDGSEIYTESSVCDAHMDCQDGSDEKDCAFTEISQRNMILLISMGCMMVVLGVGTICIYKIRENRQFKRKLLGKLRHSRLDDMEELADDDEELS